MKAPFPWFGGKSRVANIVWDRFGEVPNYVEPFFGSGAVLLGRPHEARTETVNDIDCFLANFWRAVHAEPASVAEYADWPINEADLHARHLWLVNQIEFRERMKTDPEYFDAKIAGWWVWGICQWIGSGWCSKPEWRGRGNASRAPRGIQGTVGGRKRQNLKRSGLGVHRRQIPDISGDSGATGRGIHASARPVSLEEWFFNLQARLRRVRVCCGDWKRILGPSPTTKIGITGVFLDPPYDMRIVSDKSNGSDKLYDSHSNDVSAEVAEWARANGSNFDLRIALCGYEGEHSMPGWDVVEWKAPGGYGSQAKAGNASGKRERIWFSPHCLKPTQGLLPLAANSDACERLDA